MTKANKLGCIMMAAGVFLGLYVGVYVCFIGGIVDIINEIKAPESVHGLTILWALIKIGIASIAGWVSFALLAIPGYIKFTQSEEIKNN